MLPADLDVKLEDVPAGTLLVRFHSPAYGPTAFNPHTGKLMANAWDGARFSPFPEGGASNVPTLYAGSTDLAAALESLFHDLPHIPNPEFPTRKLKDFSLSRFESTRPIRVLTLVNHQLRQVSVEGRDGSLREDELIHSLPTNYPVTRAWAQHFHRSIADLEGLAWRPRLGGEGVAYILFGQFSDTDFKLVDDRLPIYSGRGRVLIDKIAARAHIRLIDTGS